MRKWLGVLILVLGLAWSPPARAQRPFAVSGTITTNSTDCSTAGSCVVINGPWANQFSTVGVDLSGTWTGTVSFEGTIDGATWRAVAANPVAGGSAVSSTTSGGAWQVQSAGMVAFRCRGSAAMTGTVAVQLQASQSSLLTGGGGGGGSGTVSSSTSGYIAQYTAATTVGTPSPLLDNGVTTSNTLTYAGSGGITASAGPLTSGTPAGGVGSSFFLQQEGTAPTGLSASGQDNCYSSSTQHGILCKFNAGSTLPLVQGPASDTSGNLPSFGGTNGGVLADSGVAVANVPTQASNGAAGQVATYTGTNKAIVAAAPYTVQTVNMVVDTSTPVTVSTTNYAEYHMNENATAGTAVTYNLPTAAASKQFCFSNAYNGSAANTGTLEILTSASGQFIIYTDGTLSATGGYVISGGAAADAACVVGVDSTHWMLYVQRGTWFKH